MPVDGCRFGQAVVDANQRLFAFAHANHLPGNRAVDRDRPAGPAADQQIAGFQVEIDTAGRARVQLAERTRPADAGTCGPGRAHPNK